MYTQLQNEASSFHVSSFSLLTSACVVNFHLLLCRNLTAEHDHCMNQFIFKVFFLYAHVDVTFF